MVYRSIAYQSIDGKVNDIRTYDSTFIRFTIPRIGETVRYDFGEENVRNYKVQDVIYDVSNRCIFVRLES